MKRKHLWLLGGLLALAACKNDPKTASLEGGGPNSALINNPVTAGLPTDTTQLARIRFTEMEHDFGEVKEGENRASRESSSIIPARSTWGNWKTCSTNWPMVH